MFLGPRLQVAPRSLLAVEAAENTVDVKPRLCTGCSPGHRSMARISVTPSTQGLQLCQDREWGVLCDTAATVYGWCQRRHATLHVAGADHTNPREALGASSSRYHPVCAPVMFLGSLLLPSGGLRRLVDIAVVWNCDLSAASPGPLCGSGQTRGTSENPPGPRFRGGGGGGGGGGQHQLLPTRRLSMVLSL